MKYFVQIFVYFVLQHLPFIGTVTIDFNSIGYIGESIVLQCQDTLTTVASSADWYRGGSLMDISSSRYTQIATPTGFNLTISSLVTADAGEYQCGIAFDTSAKKGLAIHYNTKDVSITQLSYPKAIEITFIAFPAPVYVATVKEDGVQLDVIWNVYSSTQASGAIKVLLQNSTAFTNQNKIYTVHVKITSPMPLDVEKNITWVDDSAHESVLGLALGVGLGNDTICIICLIFIVILVKNDSPDPNQGASKLILGLGFGIICVACIVCIVILVTIGKPCALKLGLGLGLGLGIPFVGCIIVIVILVKRVLKPPPAPENRKMISGEEDASENPKINKEKKKGKVKEGNPEEMVDFKSKRKLPEDQADAD